MKIGVKTDMWEDKKRLVKILDKSSMLGFFILSINLITNLINSEWLMGFLNGFGTFFFGLIIFSSFKREKKEEEKWIRDFRNNSVKQKG